MDNLLARISIDPLICNGKPIIKGKRISVQTIFEFLSAGEKVDEILKQYPSLDADDIKACMKFASELMNKNYSIRAVS